MIGTACDRWSACVCALLEIFLKLAHSRAYKINSSSTNLVGILQVCDCIKRCSQFHLQYISRISHHFVDVVVPKWWFLIPCACANAIVVMDSFNRCFRSSEFHTVTLRFISVFVVFSSSHYYDRCMFFWKFCIQMLKHKTL